MIFIIFSPLSPSLICFLRFLGWRFNHRSGRKEEASRCDPKNCCLCVGVCSFLCLPSPDGGHEADKYHSQRNILTRAGRDDCRFVRATSRLRRTIVDRHAHTDRGRTPGPIKRPETGPYHDLLSARVAHTPRQPKYQNVGPPRFSPRFLRLRQVARPPKTLQSGGFVQLLIRPKCYR